LLYEIVHEQLDNDYHTNVQQAGFRAHKQTTNSALRENRLQRGDCSGAPSLDGVRRSVTLVHSGQQRIACVVNTMQGIMLVIKIVTTRKISNKRTKGE
jgi:hypothetical protein